MPSNDDDEFLEWCGGLSSVSWLPIGPCYTESYAAVLFLSLVLVSLLAQGGRLALFHQLKATGRLRKGVSGLNGSYIGLVSNVGGCMDSTYPPACTLRPALCNQSCLCTGPLACICPTTWNPVCKTLLRVMARGNAFPPARCHVSFFLR